jgi:hypothetical protein
MISLGAHHGGPELRGTPIEQAVTAAMRAATEVCGTSPDATVPAVNVVFCTPGSIMGRPDWDHGRVAKYSAKQKLLLVQVAIPAEAVSGGSPLDFVIDELHGANALAFEFYRQKGMQYPLKEAEQVVTKIRELAAAALG